MAVPWGGMARRIRMGEAAARAARPATLAKSPEARIIGELAQRERAAKSKKLLEGGRSKGEARGFGVAKDQAAQRGGDV